MKKAPLVTLEGGDGSGKTSLAAFLVSKLQEEGCPVYATREPGGTKLGELTRSLLLNSDVPIGGKAELALFLAARAEQIEEVMIPKLNGGILVICDRFHDSSVAYQGAARGLGEAFVEQLCSLLTDHFFPDLTFYLDISPEAALKRAHTQKDRIESQTLSFHQKIQTSYQALAKKYPKRIHTINAELPMEEVHMRAWEFLYNFLQKERCV